MMTILSRLWKLPIPNSLKQHFWYCFLDGFPAAARLHRNQRCGCNGCTRPPDRRHHFLECPLAQTILQTVTSCLPIREGANLAAELRLASPPPGVHQGVWGIVDLAAHAAMDRGRQTFTRCLRHEGSTRNASLLATATSKTIAEFWTCLEEVTWAPLPPTWRTALAADHPFLRWAPDALRFIVVRPEGPSP